METFPHAEMDYSRRAHPPLSMPPLDMALLLSSYRWFNHAVERGRLLRKFARGPEKRERFFSSLIKMYPLTRSHPLTEFRPATQRRVIIWKLFTSQRRLRGSDSPHLERLKPARPECDASSISGVTIRSIMSVSTVKVGTTMKSMKPGDKDSGELFFPALCFCFNKKAQRRQFNSFR